MAEVGWLAQEAPTLLERTLLEELVGWASQLDLQQVPERIVRYAQSQIVSQLGSVRAAMKHPQGESLQQAFGPPLQQDPVRSAYVLGVLTSCLHFDDTAFTGQLSSSTVAVAIAYCYAHGLSGAQLLTAVIAANECAARIGAATTLGPFRGQTAVHTHLAGSIAARLHTQSAPADEWCAAMSSAFTMPPWPLLHGFLGSDAKVWSAAAAIRLGLDACDAASIGFAGPPDILEHPKGFLARYATAPLPEFVVGGLGSRWHTDTLSFKMHPCGPVLDAAVDCAIELSAKISTAELADIDEVVVATSMYSILVEQASADYQNGPRTPLSALVFSTPYVVATALSTGNLTVEDLAPPAVVDPVRWRLAEKVRVEHDAGMTRAALTSDIPFGLALRQAGVRAAQWLDDVGGGYLSGLIGELPPAANSFEHTEKVTPARVSVRFGNGRQLSQQIATPSGAAGAETRLNHAALVQDKFRSVGGDPDIISRLGRLEAVESGDLQHFLEEALA